MGLNAPYFYMITLYKGFKYDNQYDYVKGFSSRTEQETWFNSIPHDIIEEPNYVKNNNIVVIPYHLDDVREMGVNYLSYNNGTREIYNFIVRKEYANNGATRLYLEVDVFQTYMFNYTLKKSFIERKKCTINEITDYDEGLYLGEHKIVSDTVAITKGSTYFALFSGIKDFEVTFDEDGKIKDYFDLPTGLETPMTQIDGILYPLFFVHLTGNALLTALSDHPSLVAIVRFPQCTFTTVPLAIPKLMRITSPVEGVEPTYETVRVNCNVATSISSATVSGSGGSVPKAEVTDFFPYTYYVLTDGETEPLIMKPQDLPGSISVIGEYALSHQPVERFYVQGYKGDNTGRTYNITNVTNMTLPTATNTGMQFLTANAGMMSLQRKGQVTENILGGVSSVAGAVGSIAGGIALAPVTGGLSLGAVAGGVGGLTNTVGNITSGIQKVKEMDRRAKDMTLTPSSISSMGTPSTRNKFNTGSVRVLKYTVSDQVKQKIKDFCERYGNKFNRYEVIDHKGYKGYIKMINPNFDTSIDNEATSKLIEIYERGVYID